MKLKLEIAGQEIEMTMEEAKLLKSQLDELFGSTHPVFIPYSVPLPMVPQPNPWETTFTCHQNGYIHQGNWS